MRTRAIAKTNEEKAAAKNKPLLNEKFIVIQDDDDEIQILERKNNDEILERKDDDIKRFINELKKSIRAGDTKKAANCATRLAHLNADLNITIAGEEDDHREKKGLATAEAADDAKMIAMNTPPAESPVEQAKQQPLILQKVIIQIRYSYEDDEDTGEKNKKNGLNRVEIEVNAYETKISDLKARIGTQFGLAADKQYMMIINDCAANSDNDLLSAYESFGKRKHRGGDAAAAAAAVAAADYDENEPYEVFVLFLTDEISDGSDKHENKYIDGLSEIQASKKQVSV